MAKSSTKQTVNALKAGQYYLRIRDYPETPFVSVWLCRKNPGGSSAGLLHGQMYPDLAEHLVEALGMPVDRDHTPISYGMNEEQKQTMDQQRELFS